MLLDFYNRSAMPLIDTAVQTIISHDHDVAKQGYVVDRLKEITVERHGPSYWKYKVPVMRVTN